MDRSQGYLYWRPVALNPKASMMRPLVFHYTMTTQNDALISAVMTRGGYKLKAKSIESLQSSVIKLKSEIKRANKK